MDKGQGALEYLLLIGGAILVSAISIGLIVNLTAESEIETVFLGADAICAKYLDTECSTHDTTIQKQFFHCYRMGPNQCRGGRGLVGAWHFNGNTIDSAGSGFNGTINGGITCSSQGMFGSNACNFDGIDDYIVVADPDLGENVFEFSVTAWVKATQPTSNNTRGIISYWQQAGKDAFGMRIHKLTGGNGKVHFFVENSNFFQDTALSNDIFNTTEWTHLAGVYSNNTLYLYIDGVLQDSQPTVVGPTVQTNREMWIGRDVDAYWEGELDEVAVWHRALSAGEIQNLAKK